MDASKEYIKMCDCPEIQGGWEIRYGDWVGVWAYDMNMREDFVGNHHIVMKHSNPKFVYTLNDLSIKKDKCLWLPRQDQIQEMMIDCFELEDPMEAITFLATHILSELPEDDHYHKAKTPEQLWLAFYMHEKHSKIWDGKEWVKK